MVSSVCCPAVAQQSFSSDVRNTVTAAAGCFWLHRRACFHGISLFIQWIYRQMANLFHSVLINKGLQIHKGHSVTWDGREEWQEGRRLRCSQAPSPALCPSCSPQQGLNLAEAARRLCVAWSTRDRDCAWWHGIFVPRPQVSSTPGTTAEVLSTFRSLEPEGWEGVLLCDWISPFHLLSSSYFLNFALYYFYGSYLFCSPWFPQILNAKHGGWIGNKNWKPVITRISRVRPKEAFSCHGLSSPAHWNDFLASPGTFQSVSSFFKSRLKTLLPSSDLNWLSQWNGCGSVCKWCHKIPKCPTWI